MPKIISTKEEGSIEIVVKAKTMQEALGAAHSLSLENSRTWGYTQFTAYRVMENWHLCWQRKDQE